MRVGAGGRGGEVVKWDRVKKSVGKLMDGGEDGRERRRRARELAGRARGALEEEGSSYLNISFFIQDVLEQVAPITL